MREVRGRRALLTIVTVLALVLTLAACGDPTVSQDATAKGQELASRLADLSVDLPAGSAAALFAEDGAHLCAAADSKDHLAPVAFAPNGFALRKLAVDRQDVEIAEAVIDVYCPERRDTFDDYVAGLAVDDAND